MTHVPEQMETAPEKNEGDRPVKYGHLKYQFLWCFLTIATITLGVSIGLMIELGNGMALADGISGANTEGIVEALRWRIAWGAMLIITVAGCVFFLLSHRIASPLEKAARAAGRMAEGHLGTTAPEHPPNEIGRIGESINGLVVNFQEVLILIWNQTENAIASIQHSTRKAVPGGDNDLSPELMAELKSARQDLETMRMMVRSFDLYDVTISDGSALTAKEVPETLN